MLTKLKSAVLTKSSPVSKSLRLGTKHISSDYIPDSLSNRQKPAPISYTPSTSIPIENNLYRELLARTVVRNIYIITSS